MTQFKDLGLAGTILRAVEAEGYSTPTPIQAQAIPHLLKGRDLLGIAQTGTGKTAAFALPILERLTADRKRPVSRRVRALVLAPTRELAAQIAESFRVYGRNAQMQIAVIFGGVSYGPQVKALNRGLDILVATPGRLIDHLEQGTVKLDETEIVVLDEADHMLDLGFIVPIRDILSRLPARRQTLLFSATMPREIASLAADMLKEPVEVTVKPVGTTAERVDQSVFMVSSGDKNALLLHLMQQEQFQRTLIFTRTKRGADRVTTLLSKSGIDTQAIHGNKSQAQREKALASFKRGSTKVLVATDIAARGIDVDNVTHVVNYELPDVPEAYVHRIGRTARAGADGKAVAFCAPDERTNLRGIQKLTRQDIPAFIWSADKGVTAIEGLSALAGAGEGPTGRSGSGRKPGRTRPGRNERQRNAAERAARTERGRGEGRPSHQDRDQQQERAARPPRDAAPWQGERPQREERPFRDGPRKDAGEHAGRPHAHKSSGKRPGAKGPNRGPGRARDGERAFSKPHGPTEAPARHSPHRGAAKASANNDDKGRFKNRAGQRRRKRELAEREGAAAS